jgi:hypothetical protein
MSVTQYLALNSVRMAQKWILPKQSPAFSIHRVLPARYFRYPRKEKKMKPRMILLTLAFCLVSTLACFASDPNLGTWKLNEAKSKIPAGAPKNETVVYTANGDKYTCVVDGLDGAGKPSHNEWTGMFDGKDYPLTGDSTADTRAIKKTAANKYSLTNKKAGKPVVNGTIELSADGKTRTVVTHGEGASGKPVTFVYEKQ